MVSFKHVSLTFLLIMGFASQNFAILAMEPEEGERSDVGSSDTSQEDFNHQLAEIRNQLAQRNRENLEHQEPDIIEQNDQNHEDLEAIAEAIESVNPQEDPECPICLENKTAEQLEQLNCGCRICKECAKRLLTIKFRDERPAFNKITCPCNISGHSPISREALMRIIPENDSDMRARMLGAYDTAVNFDQHPVVADQSQIDPATAFYMRANTRTCQKCRAIISRTGGCNHMTCVCGYQFCYNCGAAYDGHGRCPGCGVTVFGAEAIPSHFDFPVQRGNNNLNEPRAVYDIYPHAFRPNNDGNTPLHLASLYGNTDLVNNLIANGANLDARNNHGDTPLHLASLNGHVDIVNALIVARANVNAENQTHATPLHLAAQYDQTAAVSALCVAPGINVNARNHDGHTPLHLAAENGHADAIDVLLTPHIEQHNIQMVRYNIVRNIPRQNTLVDVRCTRGFTPLHLAAEHGHVGAINALLRGSANVNELDNAHNTPLHLAARNGHPTAINALLVGGAYINAKNSNLNTPLHLAAAYGPAAVKTLLANGARRHMRNRNGDFVTTLAYRNGHIRAFCILALDFWSTLQSHFRRKRRH